MAYTPYTWQNDNPGTPLSAANLNHIEQGIAKASTTADNALPSVTTSNESALDFNNARPGIVWATGRCPNSPKPSIEIYGFLVTLATQQESKKIQLAILTWDGENSQGFYYRTFAQDYDSPWSPWAQVDYNDAKAMSIRSMADLMVEAAAAPAVMSEAAAAPAVMADQPSTVTEDVKAYVDARVQEAIAQYAAKVKALAEDTDA